MNVKLTLFLIIIVCTVSVRGQMSKTETKDLKKIGNIQVSLVRSITDSDTTYSVMMIQLKSVMLSPIYGGGVTIIKKELAGIYNALESFNEDIKKGTPKNDVTNTFTGETTIVTCSYTKMLGWEVYISNANKEIEKVYDKAEQRTGMMYGQVVIIKPKQIKEFIDVLKKAEETKFE